jgi:hypothetical protein
MIDPKQWSEDLSEYESWCLGQWFNRNGIKTKEDFFKLFHEFDEKKGSGTIEESFSAFWSIGKERKLLPFPSDLQDGIRVALGKLIKRSFEDDIHSQKIDLQRFKKLESDYLKPLGFDANYVSSYIFNIKTEAIEETIAAHSNYWPYPQHKIDHLYTQLLQYQFIDPSGQFKAMFLQKNPPALYRILWKTNRTDLVYFGYKLYYEIYADQFLDVINKLFLIKNRRGEDCNLRDFKKSFNNIRSCIENNDLISTWKRIDSIFDKLGLFLPNK